MTGWPVSFVKASSGPDEARYHQNCCRNRRRALGVAFPSWRLCSRSGERADEVKFWDSSAIVPLLIEEASTPRMRRFASEDPSLLVWWGARIECASAIARMERGDAQPSSAITTAHARLAGFAADWGEVDPTELVREAAARFVRVHPLRAADALQLAAAFVASDRRPESLAVVTLDERLEIAARKEGFAVIGS
jgi:predicted nucleic acid-binding protein